MRFFWHRKRDEHEQRHSTFGASSFGASSMALLMVAPTAPVQAGDQQARMAVSATVLKRASLKVLAQPSAVVITAEDVARGYVDVAAPAQVAIRSNSAQGYALEFSNEADFMREIHVRGLGTELQLGPAGGVVTQPGMDTGVLKSTLALHFRFLLSEAAHEGAYPWPVHLSVAPI